MTINKSKLTEFNHLSEQSNNHIENTNILYVSHSNRYPGIKNIGTKAMDIYIIQ